MKTKGVTEKKSTAPTQLQQRSKEEKLARQHRIARDKERARLWAEQRKLKNNPVQAVRELQLETNRPRELKQPTVSRDKTKEHSATVIRDLQARKAQLVTEIERIDQAIAVIRQTYTSP